MTVASDARADDGPVGGQPADDPAREPAAGHGAHWRRFHGRKPGPPAAFGWRWIYPVALVLLGVLTVALAINGSRLVLHSKDGTLVKIVHDPTQPGFFAQVAPTPTLLVVQTDGTGALVSAAVLSLATNDTGGSAVFFPPELMVPVSTGKNDTLAHVLAQQGVDGPGSLRSVIAKLMDADVDTVVQVKADALAALMAPVAPLRYTLPDAVRVVQNGKTTTLLPKGAVQIRTADDVSAATEAVSPNEASIARASRQLDFWRAWVAGVKAAADKSSAFPASAEGTALPRFIKALAAGQSNIDQAPFDETAFKGATLYVADTAKLKAVSLQMIPYPLPYEAGARLRVDVRNGVGNLTLNEPMNRKVVAAGGQIIVLGNADAFNVARTAVVYYDQTVKDRASALAQAIHATDVQFVDRPDSSIDVTVTIGADFVP